MFCPRMPKKIKAVENLWKTVFSPPKLIGVGRKTGFINYIVANTRKQARELAAELKEQGRNAKVFPYLSDEKIGE